VECEKNNGDGGDPPLFFGIADAVWKLSGSRVCLGLSLGRVLLGGLSVEGGLANSSDRGCFDAFVVFGGARVGRFEGRVGFRNSGPAVEFESCCDALRRGCFLSNVSVPFVRESPRLMVFFPAASDAFLTRAEASPELVGADVSLSIPSSDTIGGETSVDFVGGVVDATE
jgi:hypothetical protein